MNRTCTEPLVFVDLETAPRRRGRTTEHQSLSSTESEGADPAPHSRRIGARMTREQVLSRNKTRSHD